MKKLLAVASALALTVSAVSPAVLAAETLATQQTETSARENMQKILEYPNKPCLWAKSTIQEKTIGEIWGYKTIGIAQTQEEMDKHLANGGKPNWDQPGVPVISCMPILTEKTV